MKVSSIDCRRLRKIIRKECGGCLIVDCRPYFSFTNSSIKGSVNVNLNSVVVRRSRGGPVPLQFVIPDERALFRLREGSISAIVALDDRTSHWQKLKKDSVAQIVINTLSHLASGASICFLKGEILCLILKNKDRGLTLFFSVCCFINETTSLENKLKAKLSDRRLHYYSLFYI